jgi:hypothetical protein
LRNFGIAIPDQMHKKVNHFKGDTEVGTRFVHSLLAHSQGITDDQPKAIGHEDAGDLNLIEAPDDKIEPDL